VRAPKRNPDFVLPRLRPLINFALHRIGRTVEAQKTAEATVLEPGQQVAVHPPFFVPGQLQKATAVIPGVESLQKEIDLARRSHDTHAPLIRYTLEHCLVHHAGFDGPRASFRKQALRGLGFLTAPTRPLPAAVYCMSDPSHLYFGHWLLDACAVALLAGPGETPILDVNPAWPNAAQYVPLLGLQPAPAGQYAVRRLTFYQDYGLGHSKRARWAQMRRRLREAIPDAGGSACLYLRRGSSGKARTVANEDRLVEQLVRRGFDVLDIDGAPASRIQQGLRAARLVVSMEGSHLSHAYVAMAPGAALVVLIPADRFNLVQLGYARGADLRFGFVVVAPTPTGYAVDLPDLLRTLDLAA
jgi:hypothetical protein